MARAWTINWFLENMPSMPTDLIESTFRHHSKKLLWYKKESKEINGCCSACGKKVSLKKATHGRFAECPECGAKVKLVDADKENSPYLETICVEVANKFFGHLMVRYYLLNFKYKNNMQYTCEYEFIGFEVGRQSIKYQIENNGAFDVYAYRNGVDCYSWYCKGGCGWRRGRYAISGGTGVSSLNYNKVLYTENLDEILSELSISTHVIKDFARKRNVNNVAFALSMLNDFPQVESMIKCGFNDLASEFFRQRVWYGRSHIFNGKEKSLLKYLAVDKATFSKLPKNVKSKSLESRKEVKEIFGCDVWDKCFDKCRILIDSVSDYTIEKVLKYMPKKAFFKYFRQQIEADKRLTARYFAQDFIDYIEGAEKLNYNLKDTSIIKPKNFKDMHDRTLQIISDNENKKKNAEFKKAMKKWTKLAFSFGDYTVILPQKAMDISAEGRALFHCVGGYVDRILRGDSIIVFIRESKQIYSPLVTVELSPKDFNIVQARAAHNREPDANVKKMLTKYKAYLTKLNEKELKKSKPQPIKPLLVAAV